MAEQIEVNKTMLVVLALHTLGGEADLEHIAVKAHEMFPQQFCWRSFPQFPDKDAVRVHLSEAKKKTFGALVADKDLRFERKGERGYTKRFALTKRGMERARELSEVINAKAAKGGTVTASRNSLDYRRLVAPVLSSVAFEQFSNGRRMAQVGKDSFLEAFQLFPDASPFVITGRINRVAAAVSALPATERERIDQFIQEGRDAFGY